MATSKKSIPDNLENYILAIEKRESNRRLTLIILLVLLLIGGGATSLYLFLGSTQLQVPAKSYALDELDYDTVEELLALGETPILVKNAYGRITDSIYNLNDYDYLFIRNMPTSDTQPYENVSETHELKGQEETKEDFRKLPVFPLDIEGERVDGSQLRFTVVGFDPSITYMLDLGNGTRRSIGQRFEYSFPKPGTYNVRLVARSRGFVSSEFKLPVKINANAQRSEPSRRDTERSSSVLTNVGEQELGEKRENRQQDPLKQGTSTLVSNEGPTLENTAKEDESSSRPEEEKQPEETNSLGTMLATAENDVAPIPEIVEEDDKSLPEPASSSNIIPSKDANLPLIQPKFPGGTRALGGYIGRRLNYPEAARRNNVEGKVYVTFTVDREGNILNPKVIKGLGYGCDQEVLRIVQKMPKWIPASQGGTKLSVPYTLPITFRLQ